MRKTRILIANDASCLGTGYAVYGKELLTRLNNTGRYEIAELACYLDKTNPKLKQSPWKMYPNSPVMGEEQKEYDEYMKHPSNQFGEWRFHEVCLHFEPDIVFDLRDYWMYAFEETSPYRIHFKWVVMPTVDSAPQKDEWLHTFANMDLIVPYTEWAKNTLQSQCGNRIKLFPDIANAGVNFDDFYPQDKQKVQKELFGRELSITGTVMRNQKRKLFPDLLKAYRQYLNRLLEENRLELYDKSYLLLHTSYPESSGWDFASLLLEHDLADKVYFSNICRKCLKVSVLKFHQGIAECPACTTHSVGCSSPGSPVSSAELAQLYNSMDLFMQVAICEGFGMPQVEAAACGVPIASVDYSAMSEIVRNLEGYKIEVQAMFRERETGADRAQPSVDAIAKIMYEHHVLKTDEEKKKMGERSVELCKQYYSWDRVADVWDRALQSVDISTNLSWDEQNPLQCNNEIKVPGGLEPAEFVKFIVSEIINEPFLLKTTPMREIIKNFGMGYATNGKDGQPETYENVIKLLEKFLNKKNTLENIKMNRRSILKDRDFLHD